MTVLATVRNTGSHTAHNILSPLGEWSGGMTITQVIDWASTMPFDEFGYDLEG